MSRIVFGILVCGVEPFFPYVLRNVYASANKIVVLEGYGHDYWEESDSTWIRDRIAEFDDKDKKIVYKNIGRVLSYGLHRVSVRDKNILMGTLFDFARSFMSYGDWFVIMPGDGLLKQETIDYILSTPEEIVWVGFAEDNFVGNFSHTNNSPDWLVPFWKDVMDRVKRDNGRIYYDRNDNGMVNSMYEERAVRYFEGHTYYPNFCAVTDIGGSYVYAADSYRNRRVLLPLDHPTIRSSHYRVGTWKYLIRKISYHYRRMPISMIQPMIGYGEWLLANHSLQAGLRTFPR